ncbi:MAG TPA: uracil-DNA glycosylase, partial [Blastocatellia bacterium]|nr:uracil-DNA glycosylase [Blastocatellia bacterium]
MRRSIGHSEGTLSALQDRIVTCRACPRLVEWREAVAREKVRRFQDQDYWGKPVPSFGDPRARLLILGLAPAAHGANRTGRMFTGDSSGDWLYRALHRAGFANKSEARHREDGLVLTDCYISAVLHCAPPANKPARDEIHNCREYIANELELLGNLRLIVALGRIAFDSALVL